MNTQPMSRSPLFAGLLAVLVTFPVMGRACVWVDGSTLDGEPISHNNSFSLASRVAHAMKRTPSEKLQELDGSGGDAADQREREAVRKLLSGHPAEAIPLLQRIEEEEPGKYLAEKKVREQHPVP